MHGKGRACAWRVVLSRRAIYPQDMSTVSHLHTAGSLAVLVAENVRAETARAGLTQADIAREMGMAQSAVSARWRGTRQWQLEDLERVAEILNVTPTLLLRPRQDSNLQPTVVRLRTRAVAS